MLLPGYGPVTNSLAFFPTKELNWYDTYLDNFVIATPTIWSSANLFCNPDGGTLVSTPPVGDRGYERHSRGILVKNLQISGVLTLVPEPVTLSPPIPTWVYIALVLDTQANGAQCVTQDIFTNQSTSPVLMCFPPFRNMDSNTRFQVLWWEKFKVGENRAFTIDATSIPPEFSVGGDYITFDKYLPTDLLVRFNGGNSSAVSSVVDNAIHVMASQTGNSAGLYLNYKCRIRFANLQQ